MLKAVMVGSLGHYYYAFDGIKLGAQCEITAAAPGPTETLDEYITQSCGKIYDSYIKMFEEEKPDIAIINPQISSIAECALKAIGRGIHIFCEKPLAITWKDIRMLEEAAVKSNARICTMMGMRHFAAFKELKKILDSGELGNIRLIHAQKSYRLGERPEYYKKRNTYGGTIPWIGSHPTDMIYWLSGRQRFTKIFASHTVCDNNDLGELESCAGMMFENEAGIISTANIDYLRPLSSSSHADDRIRVVGSENWAEIYGGKLFVGEKEREIEREGSIFKDFCSELEGAGYCSITNDDSIYITKICLAARDSADMGKLIEIGENI